MTTSPRSIVLAGGGTAGHVNPLLATADALRAADPNTRILVLGTQEGLESTLVPRRGYDLVTIPKTPMPRRPNMDLIRFPARYRQAIAQATDAIRRAEADVVVGFGGYVSTPAYEAARRLGVPVVIHEGNARPGWANKRGSRWAAAIATTFPMTRLRDGRCIGMPLMANIVQAADHLDDWRAQARADFGLPDRTTILVTGGSLGAAKLNTVFPQLAPDLDAAGVNVIHISGRGKADAVNAALDAVGRPAGYIVKEYQDDMLSAYAAASLVVCRAGAATVCELAVLGRPAIFVPLPFGNGEQALNADLLISVGGALRIDDKDVTPDRLRAEVMPVLESPDVLTAMADASRAQGRPRATDELITMIEGAMR